MAELRKSKGVREISPGVFEIYASLGRDPLSGKYLQTSRYFHGSFKEAKLERAALVLEVGSGRFIARRVTVDELVPECLQELRWQNRSVTTTDEYERRYERDIKAAIGHVDVSKVTTKMLTDLYAAHKAAGAAPGSVRKIHTVISSMMSQACRWGLRKDNPATWASVPTGEAAPVVVPKPEDVLRLIEAARQSKRPVYAKVIFLAATTGIRRGELCALRVGDIGWDKGSLSIELAMQGRRKKVAPGEPRKVVGPTKSRRRRVVGIDKRSLQILRGQVDAVAKRAADWGEALVDDPYVFTDSLDGSESWHPDAVTRYFSRLRDRNDLGHVTVKSLRAFMDTYGQELGFTLSQVAMRAGHDPAVASRHYTGKVSETDHEIAGALSDLLGGSSF
ncbi:MAG: site-specific integrase [Acidimicrobiales bacterium]